MRGAFESKWGVRLKSEPGLRIPNMFEAALDGSFKGVYVQGEDIAQSDPNTNHVTAALAAMECVVVQDLFLNETAKYAHVFLPGSSFLEKDGTFTNAERRISRVRKVMEPRAGFQDWEVTMPARRTRSATRCATGIRRRSWTRSRASRRPSPASPTRSSIASAASSGRATTRRPKARRRCTSGRSCAGKGKVLRHRVRADDGDDVGEYPLVLTTGRILSQYNVGAQTRRTENVVWASEDVLGDSSARRGDARHRRRRLGGDHEPRRQHRAARGRHRSRAAGRGLHDVPFSRSRAPTSSPRRIRTGRPTARIQGDGRRSDPRGASAGRGGRASTPPAAARGSPQPPINTKRYTPRHGG